MPTPKRVDTPERQKAARIRQSFNEQVTALRQQKNLNREGRAARIAAAYEDAKAKLAQLRQDENQRLTDRAESLHRQLFGNRNIDPAHIASIRDARDRAAELDENPEKAAAVMTRADRDGDHVLARAYAEEISRRAMNPLAKEHGAWAHMFGQWASAQPGGTDAVAELQGISTELADPGQRMMRDSQFGIGVLPDEIRGVGNIKALADQADEIPELPPSRAEQIGAHLAKFAKADLG
jgi:hypothetical protein